MCVCVCLCVCVCVCVCVLLPPTSNEGVVILFMRSSVWPSSAASSTGGANIPELCLDLDLLGERMPPCDHKGSNRGKNVKVSARARVCVRARYE